MEELNPAFSDLFNSKLASNDDINFTNSIAEKVESERMSLGNERIGIEVDLHTLEEIIKIANNNKAVGFSEVSNEMLKHGKISLILPLVRMILEKIVQYGVIPHFFNVGKIMPILNASFLYIF